MTLFAALIFGAFFAGFSLMRSFISVFLADRGFSYTQIGIISFFYMLSSAAIQPFIAPFLDRFPKLTLRRFMQVCCLVTLLTCGLLMIVPRKLGFYLPVYVVNAFSQISMTSVLNALCLQYINRGVSLDLGIARGTGSVCYALMTSLLGTMIARWGSSITLPGNCLIQLGEIALLGFLPEPSLYGSETETAAEETEPSDRLGVFLRGNKIFSVFLISNIFIFFAHSLQNVYMPAIAEQFDAGTETVGLILGLAAILEIIPMALYQPLSRKISPLIILCFAGIGFSLKILCATLAKSVSMLAVSASMQLIAYASFAIPSTFFANQITAPRNHVLAQCLLIMSNEIGFTLCGLIGGVVLDYGNIRQMLWAATGISFIGTALLIFSVAKFAQQSRS